MKKSSDMSGRELRSTRRYWRQDGLARSLPERTLGANLELYFGFFPRTIPLCTRAPEVYMRCHELLTDDDTVDDPRKRHWNTLNNDTLFETSQSSNGITHYQ